jgi:hypothetical protein
VFLVAALNEEITIGDSVERLLALELHFGRISVTERVIAYQKKSIRDQSTLETVELDLPETSLRRGDLVRPEPEQLDGLDKMPKLPARFTLPSTR